MNFQPVKETLCRVQAWLAPKLGDLRRETTAAWQQAAAEYRRLAHLDRRERRQDIKQRAMHFLRETFVDAPRLLVSRGVDRRRAVFMTAAVLTPLLAFVIIMAPGAMFSDPSQNAYYHFASVLRGDPISLWPLVLGAITWVLALRFPLQH
jgi:hypothetical protein